MKPRSLRSMGVATWILATSLLLAGASRAEATTILDFESLAPNTFVTSYGGATWSTNWVVATFGNLPYPTPGGMGPQAVAFLSGSGYSKSFTFLTPQLFQGAWFSGPGTYFDPLNGPVYGTQLAFNLYDASNNLLHTSGSVTTNSVAQYLGFAGYQWISGTPQFLASGYNLPVSKVEVVILNPLQIPNESSFIMDGVTFDSPTAAPVPEPSSLALLGSGLFALQYAIRRRRRR